MHLYESRWFDIYTAQILVLSVVSPKASRLLGKDTAHNCLKLTVSYIYFIMYNSVNTT